MTDAPKRTPGSSAEAEKTAASKKPRVTPQQAAERAQSEREAVQAAQAAEQADKKKETPPTPPDVAPGAPAASTDTSVGATFGTAISQAAQSGMDEMKKPGFWSGMLGGNMKDMVEGLVEAKKEGGLGGMLAGIALPFLLALGKAFKVDFGSILDSDTLTHLGLKPKEGETPVEAPKTEEKPKEGVESAVNEEAYRITAQFLIRSTNKENYGNMISAFAGGVSDTVTGEVEKRNKNEVNAVNILMSSNIRKLSFEIIQSKSAQELQSISGLNTHVMNGAELVVDMIKNNTDMLEAAFHDVPEWKAKPIDELLNLLYVKKGFNLIADLESRFAKFPSSILTTGLPEGAFLGVTSDGGTDINIENGPVGARIDSLQTQGLTKKLLRILRFEPSISGQSVNHSKQTLSTRELSEGEKGFIEKITDSTPEGFISKLNTSIGQHYGFPEDLLRTLSPETLSMGDLTDIYIITGGKSSIEELSIGERALLIAKLQAYFMEKNPNQYGAYMKNVVEDSDKYQNMIQILQMINGFINDTTYVGAIKLTQGAGNTLDGLAGILGLDTPLKKLAAGGAGAGALLGIIKLAMRIAPQTRAISFIVTLLTLLGIGFTQSSIGRPTPTK